MPTVAENFAAVVGGWDIASSGTGWPRIVRVADDELDDAGMAVWMETRGGSLICLPSLVAGAPDEVVRRYQARILADLTGRCPMCGAVAGLHPDAPDPVTGKGRAGWRMLPVTIGIRHRGGCGALFYDSDRRYFDERAFERGEEA